ncbi:response regulator [Acidisoma sp. 7E03]
MPDTESLAGRRILVVEDEYFVAMDASQALREVGAEVVGPCRTEQAAIRELEQGAPDGALVDVHLGPTPSFALAEALKNRGIPFVFITGFDPDRIPGRFAGVDRLSKPISPRKVIEALARVVASRGFAD